MEGKWIEGFADKTIIGLACLYLMTEILSGIGCLNRRGVGISWFLVIVLYIIYKKKKNKKPAHSLPFGDFSPQEKWGLFVVVGLLLVIGGMAVLTVPYNWDSMTYHLTRIVHWIQDGSVDYFVTNNRRQLISPVLGEYILLHLVLLTGSDLFVNCLQFLSLAVSSVLAYDIMRRSGIPRLLCFGGLTLIATAPVIMGEALSTQTDLFAAMCLMLVTYKIFCFASERDFVYGKASQKQIILMGLAVGLGYLAKPSICYSILILMAWLLFVCIKGRVRLKDMGLFVLTGGITVFLLPVPIFLRNIRYAGDPFALAYMSGIGVGSFHPGCLLLNAYKNFATLACMKGNKGVLLTLGNALAGLLGIDINDPRITFGNGSFLFDSNLVFSYDHDFAGAGLFLLFLAAVLVISPVILIKKREKAPAGFMAAALLQFLLNLSMIRWQPWVNRLLVPAVFLTVIPFTWLLWRIMGKALHRNIITAFVVVWISLCFAIGPLRFHMHYVNLNLQKETSRWELYFAKRNLIGIYVNLCDLAKNSGKVGIYASNDAYEYPLWVRLKEQSAGSCTIENIVPEKEIESFEPDCIIVLDNICPEYEYHGQRYQAVWMDDSGLYAMLYKY